MPLKVVRNDITRMQVDVIVNTANTFPVVGTGCDSAIYMAAGYEELLDYRKKHIGTVPEGEVFLTPAFDLPAEYIIHAVSPLFVDGESGEEEKLRSCYRKSLNLALEKGVASIAFPLISTGSFGYPKEEGMRIAVDEFNAFLLRHSMTIYLVVFDSMSTILGQSIAPNLEAYIDNHYVSEAGEKEYGKALFASFIPPAPFMEKCSAPRPAPASEEYCAPAVTESGADFFDSDYEEKLQERVEHLSDTFSDYLLYLIERKGMSNAEVYKRAIVDKKLFSKIKNNPNYHPQKITVMCLCVGAQLNLDETKDLMARAGYALSPCDKTDVIFSFFIENQMYDMIELDIQLEEHGLKCLIS